MASKRRIRRRSCSKKVRHETVQAATHAMYRTGRGMHPYKCRFCKGWHIGH